MHKEPHKPLVSVVIPSYNQGRYIKKAISSVLTQDFSDFELLISDDASPDDSWEIIQNIKDPRLVIFQQQKNLGPVGNLVFLIKQSHGKYVALLNSDDYWLPGKLRKQVEIMELNPKIGACFTWADLVDETGNKIAGIEELWSDIFRQPNRTQAEWLRYFFFHGNCICHPSMLIRRDIYQHLNYYNPALRQLPDFEMWIRLVKHYPIHIVEQTFVGHLRTGDNTSTINNENSARNLTEMVEIFDGFFRDVPDALFISGFSADFRLKGVPMTPERIWCEKLFLLLDGSFVQPASQMAAIRCFYNSLHHPQIEKTLLDEYNFSVFHYYKLTGTSGFGQCWLQAMNQINPSLNEIWLATKHHLQEIGILKVIKRVFHQLRR